MRVLFLCLFLASCGYMKETFRGVQGDKGEKGEKGDPGEAGRDGNDGKDGADGSSGLPGDRGPIGLPGQDGEDGRHGRDGEDGRDGNVSYLVERYLSCSGRYDLDKYRWYSLRFDVYFLSTGENYLYGRSDLFDGNNFRPDNGFSFLSPLTTGTFQFDILDDDRYRWTHLRSGDNGFFDCESTTSKSIDN